MQPKLAAGREAHGNQMRIDVAGEQKRGKTSILVVQTAAEPPNQGRMYLLTISWTWNSRKALRKRVAA